MSQDPITTPNYSFSMMLTSPKLSPAACFRNLPVEHALHNVGSS